MMPWNDESLQDKKPTRPTGYVLITHDVCSTGFLDVLEEAIPYPTMLAARTAGEERAAAAGLQSEGWRQEAPRVWVLLPHRWYRVEMR